VWAVSRASWAEVGCAREERRREELGCQPKRVIEGGFLFFFPNFVFYFVFKFLFDI
jgi:hypothetical protein